MCDSGVGKLGGVVDCKNGIVFLEPEVNNKMSQWNNRHLRTMGGGRQGQDQISAQCGELAAHF